VPDTERSALDIILGAYLKEWALAPGTVAPQFNSKFCNKKRNKKKKIIRGSCKTGLNVKYFCHTYTWAAYHTFKYAPVIQRMKYNLKK